MSIIPLTVYLSAVFGLPYLYTANGKSFYGFSGFSGSHKDDNGGSVHADAPQPQFKPLDADWQSKFQGGDFHEVETDDGRGGNSNSGLHTSAESTTANSLGFDFKYLFEKGKDTNKHSNKNGWVNSPKNPLREGSIFDQFPKVFGNDYQKTNLNQNGWFFDQNRQGLDINNQGFNQGGLQSFDPFALPWNMQVPNFLNFGRQGYLSRNRVPPPMFGGRGYSRGFLFPPPPPPPFFQGGFGAY